MSTILGDPIYRETRRPLPRPLVRAKDWPIAVCLHSKNRAAKCTKSEPPYPRLGGEKDARGDGYELSMIMADPSEDQRRRERRNRCGMLSVDWRPKRSPCGCWDARDLSRKSWVNRAKFQAAPSRLLIAAKDAPIVAPFPTSLSGPEIILKPDHD